MKTLLIMRHAKSSWEEEGLRDRERPLNKRGRRDAPAMGVLLRERNFRVDCIISSPAVRALSTAEAVAEELQYGKDGIEQDARLYGASSAQMLMVIHSWESRWNTVLMVGHNPGLTHLVNQLTGMGVENVPTAGIVTIRYAVEQWCDIGEVKGQIHSFEYPKKYR